MSAFFLTRRRFLAASASAAALTVLPLGSVPLGGTQSGRAWAQEPVRGGRLVVAGDSEPTNLNPAIVASNGVFFVASKVIEPLAEQSYGGTDGLEPRLATSWEGSKDGLSVTFRLREGVSWHDGKPFTAADVAFSALEVWKKLQNLGRVVFRNLETVETPDDHTAIFKFSAPTPFQLIRNALPVVTSVLPAHLYRDTDIARNPANQKLVGTGPFVFAEHRPGEYFLLRRNENYWKKGEPLLDEIVYQFLPDRAAAGNALEAEEIHLAAFSAVPLADLDRISQVPGLKVHANGYESLTYQLIVEINHRRKELADLKVRQAIAHAIDRDFVVKTIFLGYAKPAFGPIPATDATFFEPDLLRAAFDPVRAEALLDEAGYKRGEGGTRFALRLLPAPFFNETKQFGDYLRQALAKIGIDAQIVGNDTPAHLKAVYTDHDFDIAVATPVYRSDPAISTTILFQSGLPAGVPFSNQYGFADQPIDALIDQAAVEIDGARRAGLYRQLQKEVAQKLPLINVADFSFITVARDTVRNVSDNPRWAVSNWSNVWIAG
ncbi:ABC transporter substrate-binding protein [Phyllobacterium sp. 0TCS1.6C]|uniref:ABC transporter substrate-binding protein n=1 Tax=unclassified Phyllobacterium TaxID=2638441 RepID=UPI002264E8DF|nr:MULTISPECIES: ABC transporter substrate-binding protein [unclassified Phyllobacterium]MCX8281334.1 ABC transporter substrate-binding protein [Phyllobacterium sp. 0TCS1.6C]MCX8296010.1 ABC transporter substrate-binding protein [Phyllobacterium sp. 0TCS1.6A]